jgi:hypothetical protein
MKRLLSLSAAILPLCVFAQSVGTVAVESTRQSATAERRISREPEILGLRDVEQIRSEVLKLLQSQAHGGWRHVPAVSPVVGSLIRTKGNPENEDLEFLSFGVVHKYHPPIALCITAPCQVASGRTEQVISVKVTETQCKNSLTRRFSSTDNVLPALSPTDIAKTIELLTATERRSNLAWNPSSDDEKKACGEVFNRG